MDEIFLYSEARIYSGMKGLAAGGHSSDEGGRRIDLILRTMTPPHVWKEAQKAMKKALRRRK